MAFALITTSVADLDSSIRCAVINGQPYPLADLRLARDAEAKSAGARSSIIKLLEREIKRQEREEKKHG